MISKSTAISNKLTLDAFLFGLVNTLGILLLFAYKSNDKFICFTTGILVIITNSWFYMIYCYNHGHELPDKEKCVLGTLYIGILATSNVLSGNRLIAFEPTIELTPVGVLFQLAVVPIISCMVTVLLCKQDFLIKVNDKEND